MSSLVIVALPAEDDLVWKVSSEKVPHLTLMYLGEVTENNNAGRMADFVEHALNVNEHGPFYLTVDYRGEFGPDKADVLFFEGGWDSKWIKQLRGHLLQQNDIRTAFEANDQFPEWVPHLTLGYPDSPAKEIPDDRRFYSVEFDRIAVWTGDYEGPEFRLKWPERDNLYDDCVAYSADRGKAAVAQVLTANEARVAMGLKAIEHASILDDLNVRDRIKAKVQNILKDVAGDGETDLDLFGDPLIRTKLQSVLEDFFRIGVDKEMAYSALGEACIEHYGVKGMRWGLRRQREEPTAVAPTAASRVPHGNKRKTKIDVEGGQNHPAHEDAVKVAKAQVKLKKSGAAALSNQELGEVANRLQLEQRVSLLTSSKGKQFVARKLEQETGNLATQGFREGVKRGAKRAARGAATVGAAAALA